MMNIYGKTISVGHLVANGYATIYNNGILIKSHFDITSYITLGSSVYNWK